MIAEVRDVEPLIGADLLAMGSRFPDWVPRREERFEYLNHAIVRRTVRVDLDLSGFYPDVAAAPRWHGMIVVPVAVLRRGSHVTFDVRAEDGSLLPRLTADEERGFVYRGVVAQAELVLAGAELSLNTRDLLYRLVHEPHDADVPDNEQMGELRGSAEFSLTLRNVRQFYYLLVPLLPDQGARRVVTFSYLEPIASSPSAEGAIGAGFPDGPSEKASGVRWLGAEVRGAGDCRSYHLEVVAPPALRILGATLKVQGANPGVIPQESVDNDRLETHAHMHLKDVGSLSWGAFACRMMLPATGIVRAAVASSIFTLASLAVVGCLIWLPGLVWFVNSKVDPGASSEAFLLVPGLVGPVLASASNHGLTTTLLLRTRLLMWLSGAASFVAAGAMAFGLDGALRIIAWAAALALASFCCLQLVLQYRRLKGASQ